MKSIMQFMFLGNLWISVVLACFCMNHHLAQPPGRASLLESCCSDGKKSLDQEPWDEHRSSWVNNIDATTTPRSEMMVNTDNDRRMVFSRL